MKLLNIHTHIYKHTRFGGMTRDLYDKMLSAIISILHQLTDYVLIFKQTINNKLLYHKDEVRLVKFLIIQKNHLFMTRYVFRYVFLDHSDTCRYIFLLFFSLFDFMANDFFLLRAAEK